MAANWPIPAVVVGIAKDRHSRHAWRDLLEQFEPFPAHAVFELRKAGGVAARPRQAVDEAGGDRIDDDAANTIGTVRVACSNGPTVEVPGQDDVRRERDQFRRVFANGVGIARGPAIVDPHVAADRSSPIAAAPARTRRGGPALPDRPRQGQKHADAPHAIGLLRARRERPRRCRAAESVMNSRRLMDRPQAEKVLVPYHIVGITTGLRCAAQKMLARQMSLLGQSLSFARLPAASLLCPPIATKQVRATNAAPGHKQTKCIAEKFPIRSTRRRARLACWER